MVASRVELPRNAAGDEVSNRNTPIADAPADRRPQLGEFVVELGRGHRLLLRLDVRFGHVLGLQALVVESAG